MLFLNVFSSPIFARHRRSTDLEEFSNDEETARFETIKAERALKKFRKLCSRLRKKSLRISLEDEARILSRERRDPAPSLWIASLCDTISMN